MRRTKWCRSIKRQDRGGEARDEARADSALGRPYPARTDSQVGIASAVLFLSLYAHHSVERSSVQWAFTFFSRSTSTDADASFLYDLNSQKNK